MTIRTLTLSLIGLLSVIAPVATKADTPGVHPAWLHARSDLRTAQYFLRVREEPNVTRNLIAADRELEAAIGEINRAAVIDRKDVDDHPRIDANLDRRGRFQKIVALMRSARADLAREEDNGQARGWRAAAYRHIDQALEHVHRAAVDLRRDHEPGF